MVLYVTIAMISILMARCVQSARMDSNSIDTYKSRQHISNVFVLMGLLFFLFLFSALRIHTGNDYQTYINHFHDIYYGNYIVTEWGFNQIVSGIYWLFNGEHYLIVFGFFAFFTILLFLIAMYRQSCDFPLTFFLFMSLGIYFQTYNTVRYYFALSLVLLSVYYILRERYVKFIMVILLASLFHKSALVVIPLYILAKIPWKKWHLILFALIALSGLFMEDFYMALMLKLYPSYVNEEEYLLEGSFSIINILRSVGVLLFSMLYYKKAVASTKEGRFYFYLNLGALALYTCFTFMPFVSRIGYYLNISHLFFIPFLLQQIESKKQRNIWKGIIIVAGIVYFAAFLYKATAINVRILPYSTWLYEAEEVVPLFR